MPEAVPTFTEFCRLARQGNVVPVYLPVLADLLSPVSAFLRIASPSGKSRARSFLLESVEGGERIGRYTYFGVNPFQVVSSRGTAIRVERGAKVRTEQGNIFAFLRQEEGAYHPVRLPGLPPFSAGAVGYLSHEIVRLIEKLPPRVEPDVDMDDALFMYFTDLAAFDHVQHRLYLISNVLTEDGKSSLRSKYDEAVRRLDRASRVLRAQLVLPRIHHRRAQIRVKANMTRGKFESMVRRGKEYILAGDVFQVVLSQRFTAPLRVPPFEVYRALRVVNPSPYMYYLGLGDAVVLGSSPEMLIKVSGRQVEYRPIAGTRPRGQTEEEDLRLEEELKSDEKERAEHIMLVDLGRNDIGRVCEFHSVQPRKIMFVERYSHVMHLVSSITGTLRPGADSYSALAACFPAGTLTGAPKVRAMEIIDELEPTRRGVYGGSVLYSDFSGNLNACVAIRTAVVKAGKAYLQAGAGIVADSVPSLEYEESVNKARAALRAVEMAEKGL
ncbi:MAG: anthranilate synthase component I [Acidobacteriota bacterium]|nr:anthranilate synthase component I [Acidobacteriota bacterium]